MRKENHVTRQFFEASGSEGHFFGKKQKTCFFIWSRGVYVLNFRSVSFFVWPGDPGQTQDTFTSEKMNILDRLLWILKTGQSERYA